MSDKALAVTDATFAAEVLKSDLPVVVDLWAPWCGPCRMVSPIIEQLAAENAGKVKVVKVNVDENTEMAGRYGVSAIPTVLVFKGGQELQRLRMVGVQTKAAYQKAMNDAASS